MKTKLNTEQVKMKVKGVEQFVNSFETQKDILTLFKEADSKLEESAIKTITTLDDHNTIIILGEAPNGYLELADGQYGEATGELYIDLKNMTICERVTLDDDSDTPTDEDDIAYRYVFNYISDRVKNRTLSEQFLDFSSEWHKVEQDLWDGTGEDGEGSSWETDYSDHTLSQVEKLLIEFIKLTVDLEDGE